MTKPLILLGLALALMACSGGTPAGSAPGTDTTGHWSGLYSASGVTIQATMQLSQAASGSITGTIESQQLGLSGPLTGDVQSGTLQGSDDQGDSVVMQGFLTSSTYKGTAHVRSSQYTGDTSFTFSKSQ